MPINKKKIYDITIIELIDNITFAESDVLKNMVYDLIDKNNYNIVIDLSKLYFIDSSCVGILLLIYKKFISAGKKLCICGIKNDLVKQTFEIMNLYKLFEIFDSIEDVLKNYFKVYK